jgi:hypothetical protein
MKKESRVCRTCSKKETKNPEAFYGFESTSGIAAGRCCRQCWVKKSIKWRQDNSEQYNRARRLRHAKNRYGITAEQFDAMYKNAVCAGCSVAKNAPTRLHKNGSILAIDHCHKTGKVRGLLCHDCNLAISAAQDTPAILRRLAKYLER